MLALRGIGSVQACGDRVRNKGVFPHIRISLKRRKTDGG
ncbi:MAG: hypothetical protein AVDCRST_MAG23-1534 [uncultured Sphingosinicella sp.]|uniref:Uncharacterized protein n=1 Tax=uncultured Sphingosinicella sp. TaxID=478748 RepID=A0A6J4U3W2_9SPHN|nr:MAG: hypothetical protein AVDCRST_MAG23-1534 [uncultured Sphingosinicella sp.]